MALARGEIHVPFSAFGLSAWDVAVVWGRGRARAQPESQTRTLPVILVHRMLTVSASLVSELAHSSEHSGSVLNAAHYLCEHTNEGQSESGLLSHGTRVLAAALQLILREHP
jgi:hypothetical protein